MHNSARLKRDIPGYKYYITRLFYGKQNDHYSQFEAEFIADEYCYTLAREKYVAILLLIVDLVWLVFSDLPSWRAGLWPRNPGYLHMFYLHVFFAVLNIIFLSLSYKKTPRSSEDITDFHKALAVLWGLLLLIWSAVASGIGQFASDNFAIYMLSALIVAALLQFSPAMILVVQLLGFATYVWAISYFPGQASNHLNQYASSALILIVAMILSVSLFRARASAFMNHKIAVRQKKEMEHRVKSRTADLVRINAELRAEIADRKVAEEKLKYLSMHDSLTELYNRLYFEEELHRLDTGRFGLVGIIVCDLDGLKLINESLGHDAGNRILVGTAKAIKKCFRTSDVVARVDGDGFAVLLPHSSEEMVKEIAQRMQAAIDEINTADNDLPVSVSLGWSIQHESKSPLSEVFKEANNHMHRDKLYRSRNARSTIIQTIMKILKARRLTDERQTEHLQYLVTEMGNNLGLAEHNIQNLRLLAQFHDIGKIGLPERLLFKPGPLTDLERHDMQRHCEIGHRISLSAPDLILVADWILKHHEWWNGKGYPLGIKGNEIPLECRILAVANAYDAMTNDRPYRKALTHEEALAELKRCAGEQFDPSIVEKFTEIIDRIRSVRHWAE
ncbi:MAG: HD domain-containing phosphohydrolase [Candidatus Saccharibacteria bacterium]